MKPQPNKFSLEDVLNAYAVEPDHGPETLERYLRDYPEYSTNLKDLSHEFLQRVVEMTGPLPPEDLALIDSAWKRHLASQPSTSLEQDLLNRMFEDDLALARGLMSIKDYAMAAETLARAIDKIHQIAAVDRQPLSIRPPPPSISDP